MLLSGDDPVQRFRRRMQGTDEATLYRNLEAGVYGAPGSERRAVAERAIRGRFTEAAVALQSAAHASGATEARVADAKRMARRAAGLAVVAFLVAVYAVLRGAGGG